MLRYITGTVPIVALCLSLCSLSAAPVPTHLMPKDPPCFYPTEVGTTWVYERKGREETITISEVEDKEGGTLITTEHVRAGNRSHHMTQLVTAKGVFLVAEGGRTYPKPWCILKLPHKVGDTWKTDGHGKDMKAGPQEKVKLPIGELTAMRVDWEVDNNRTATYWYVQGIGLVGMGIERDATSKRLKSFKRGGD